MANQYSGGGWPFGTNGQPTIGRPFDPNTDQAALSLVAAAAEVLDVDPLMLPALNDRIDPNCVSPLLTEIPTDPPEGIRAAVEVSWEEVTVLMRDDGRIDVYSDGRDPNKLEPSSTGEHDWSSTDFLHWSIGETISETSDDSPTDVTSELIDRIDADAVDRLLRPLADGSERNDSRLLLSVDGYEVAVDPSGPISVEPSLSALKRSGASLLVVGSVPEQGFDRASATLLGDPSGGHSSLFVLHGRNIDTARRRLSMAGMAPSRGIVLDHQAPARSTSVSENEASRPDTQQPDVVPVSGGIGSLSDTVRDQIRDVTSVPSDELRICVDSLGSMIDSSDLETVRNAIDSICQMVREHRGIGHFLFPVDAASGEVELLSPLFDAVVELQTGDVGVEQRWRLTKTGYETSWFPLR